ncbi:MAG: sensor histidine kinase [Magnetovibrionaceae bacterium]
MSPLGPVLQTLVGRLVLWVLALTAVSFLLFWALFQATVAKVSADVVDTRLLEFSDQVRGYWAASFIDANEPSRATRQRPRASSVPGGPDVGWTWQIMEDGAVIDQSDLLGMTGATLTPSLDRPTPKFILREAETELGPMRLAERIVDEQPPFAGADGATGPIRVHYLIGIGLDRYDAYVARHAERLQPLVLIASLPLALVVSSLMLLVILALRGQLQRLARAMDAYEAGETETIEGRFPRELDRAVSRVNGLLVQNARLIERTRKYVSKIAHDINHPLAVMKNAIQGNPEEEKLDRQIRRMAGLVNRYSSLARAIGPESGDSRRVEVRPVLQDLAEGFSIVYRRTPVDIQVRCAEELSFALPRHDLEAMISNLVSNAHKYAEETIRISAEIGAEGLLLTVEDDGPGIAPEAREAALNWGKRLDEAPPGTGFGLAIVGDIIELYDGRLALDQSDLGGLKATITLPSDLRQRG